MATQSFGTRTSALHSASVLAKTGDLRAAATHYRVALRLQPEFPEACNNLGAVLERLGETGEAMTDYQKTLQLRPDFPEAQRHLSEVLGARRR